MAAGGGGGAEGRRSMLAASAAARGPAAVPAGGVAAAEEAAAAEVVRRVRPTEASEWRRAEVVDYARRLVGAALGCEVLAFGSVPLKTYLPDGDIDLTVLGNASYDSTLVNDVYSVLESEVQNSDAEFEVKDLERIDAEVRLIKCTIENIIVDISFNQTGGICALCFLELVDHKVGNKHLFKRSIILIKAWCYYESRLLGAHHGLISTYALEILILYIFNVFHKSLHSPLEVLYKFLEYFSKFDWDNYCISLNGPVALSSLPNLIVEATVTHTDDLLFDNELLKSSVDRASLPLGDPDACCMRFRPKHLNIIDPLKEYNNLGRSVNKASFHRIRTAFSFGAQKLGQILMLPPELVPDGIYGFFKNTLGRNGRGVRPDVGSNGVVPPSFGTGVALLEDISSLKISYKEDENKIPRHLSRSYSYNSSHVRINEPTCLSSCLPGGHSIALCTDLSRRSSHFVHHALEQFSSFYQENGTAGCEKCSSDHKTEQVSHCTAKAFHMADRSSIQSQVHVNNPSLTFNSSADVNTLELSTVKKNCSAVRVEKHHLPPSSLSLPELSGDLDSKFRCLRQVQYHLEYLFDGVFQSVQEAFSGDKFQKDPPSVLLNTDTAFPGLLLPSSTETNGRKSFPVSCSHGTEDVSQHLQNEDPWDVAFQRNISLPAGTEVPSNELSPSSSYADSEISSVSWCYSSEDTAEMHGPDTYFPRKSYDTCKERLASSRENGKILTNKQVRIESDRASAPGVSSVSYKEQVALCSRTKQRITGQRLKVYGYIHSDRKVVEKRSCDTRKEPVRRDSEDRQIPKYHRDDCSNKNFFQKKICYDTNMEFARAPSTMNQMPKYRPFNIHSTIKEFASGSLSKNLSRKQSHGPIEEPETLDWPAKQIPICEPLKLQNKQRGRVCSKKNSAGNQNYSNHKEHLSSVRAAEHIPCSHAVSTLNGLEREADSNKLVENGSQLRPLLAEVPLSMNIAKKSPKHIEFGSLGPFALTFSSSKSNKATNAHPDSKVFTDTSALVLQRSRAGSTQNRSPGFCKVGDEDEFPPLSAGVR